MGIQRQVVLECVQPSKGHNKFYEINISDQNKTEYKVQCRWGRIEHFKDGNPQSQVKGTDLNWDEAMSTVGTIMYSKLKKGYKVVKDTSTNPYKKVEFTSKSQEKRVAAQTHQPFERTEHVEVIVTEWWTHDKIEERAV